MTLAAHAVGDGRPLVLLPWFGLDHTAMRAAFEPVFTDVPGWRRVYIDLPGTGDSAAIEPNSDAVLDAVLATIRDTVGSEPFSITGCSYGGYLSAAVARRQPEQVRGLLLVCAGVKIIPADRNLSGVLPPVTEHGWLTGVPEDLHDHFDIAIGQQSSVVARRMTGVFAGNSGTDDDFLGRLRPAGYRLSDEDAPHTFGGHVTVLAGKRDRIAGYLDLLGAMGRYPHGDFVLVGDAGHYLPLEQPEVFTALTRAWLARHETGATA